MVEIQVQMHKRNRVKILDKTVAVFSSKGCAEKSFLSHWKIPGRRTYRWFQQLSVGILACVLLVSKRVLSVFYGTLENRWRNCGEQHGSKIFWRMLCFAVLSTQDIVWKIPNGVFFMSISGRKRSDHDPSERKEEALWNKKQTYGSVTFWF